MADSVDPDKTAPVAVTPVAVWTGSALFAETYLFKLWNIIYFLS